MDHALELNRFFLANRSYLKAKQGEEAKYAAYRQLQKNILTANP
jgi:hypothetical protein